MEASWNINRGTITMDREITTKVGSDRANLLTVLALFLPLMLTGCSSHILESRWRESQAAIDGIGAAWRDTLVSLDDKKTFVGVLNDEECLYIRMVTTNRDLESQIIRQGLTFWFDRDGGEQKKFGIRFPLGMERFSGGRESRREWNPGQEAPRRDSIYVPVNDVEILGADDGGTHRVAIASAGGIDARFQTSHDTLTYTLKFPISSSGYFPYTIGTRPGKIIGVIMESSNNRGGEKPPEGSGEGGGRRGAEIGGYGGRGRYGSGGYGNERSGRAGQSKPFSQFVRVRLAVLGSESR
jgi:hypothetical protein